MESSVAFLKCFSIGYFSTINSHIEKQANVTLINTLSQVSLILLYFRCKRCVTLARRCFRDVQYD